ncbi:N-acetylmuramoyl-L-alanine amidase [Mesorhizobium sp. ZC-5]|uniref:N-acetylmuramoyl-L-alanine amidase n=1 Tax=Mesorhizobium sp. ZC-5 TaxID=2986066 RepID=UPI00399162EF
METRNGWADLTDKASFSGIWFHAVLCGFLLALFVSLPLRASAAPLEAKAYKMAGDATHMRIVMQFDREPDPRWFLLRGPHRLVIDLPETNFSVDARELKARGLVAGVRFGNVGEGRSRLILSAKGPFAVERVEVLENEKSEGYRLVADIAASSERVFDEALAEQTQTTGSTQATKKTDRLGQMAPRAAGKRFTIVIDPGHGGIDGGAEGVNGAVEKSVTLAFATELKKKLEQTGPYNVFLTREKDEFLRLDERVRIARQHEADLFISIHADTIRLKGIRGATVYTVSDKASDAEAAALAVRENLSDELAGIEIEEENHEVADILVDLIRRETHTFSMRFARSLVGELSTAVELINNPHRSAGFKVLRAPDVPSVLVELGYLSNAKDEAQLLDPDWRGKAAERISAAVELFATERTGTGG